ncbi:MAG TPA: hypothetical protein DEE98_08895 [Elusimicrobia bacterium]|nr:MAG: hypothetical protein A2204_02370 [Elusimicrobia bacterium RIFOXYA1_FULL_47_7]OGS11628.1 MAG: hypothetical protein A2386_04970 [Elusimicrobia bacterium RIFOXYB1_FULL_48_9]OGS15716.1 MAG: hypothetical protein A2251_08505 [Elusimicrobia bacterium RIFOXYA2_FULL_47_53]OGS27065.1 MAG: hypothetical protein A2339_01115 [Elusimicrobia bacterium RIFOXYB12_FULL_50_12]OGS31017.1 MAG: hypothetical protein A2323_06825 [Elusimicrobia bacterium RIFOXYB2_FULL_46_23]HBU70479.1 hypothetical protein [Elus
MSKRRILILSVFIALASVSLLSTQSGYFKRLFEKFRSIEGRLTVADFDNGRKSDNLGGEIGPWDKDPADKTQGCRVDYSVDSMPEYGKCVKINYDVDSPNAAFNGFYMKLGGLDASAFEKFSFWIKGDPKKFKMELKNDSGESASTYITGCSAEWQRMELPFSSLKTLKNRSGLTELVIVFEDDHTRPKTGSLYLDEVILVKPEKPSDEKSAEKTKK